MDTLRIGTRGSELALFQANAVAALLARHARIASDIVVIKTSGDRLADASLSQIGGKRLFVKEIEDALLAGEIDLAVHSSKDMPALLPSGLRVGAVLPARRSARRARAPDRAPDIDRPASARSTRWSASSVPRRASARAASAGLRSSSGSFPGARFLPVRGNLGTRLRKLDAGEYDALVLAAAGLRRLGRADRITAMIPTDVCVPAPGQGIIAVEIRDHDERADTRWSRRSTTRTRRQRSRAERAVVSRLGGGCQMPIGAMAELADGRLALRGVVVSPDGGRIVRASASGSCADAESLGRQVADELLRGGAGDILADVQRAHAAVEGIQP